MADRPFDLFVILGGMRTGSNLLEAHLSAATGITCHGEAFNPHFIGGPSARSLLGVTLPERMADPHLLLRRLREAPGLNGFRYFHDHDPRVLPALLADPRCAKIVLTRNPLDSFLSLGIARETGQWRLGDARHRRTAMLTFSAGEFESYLDGQAAFREAVLRGLRHAGQAAFLIDYDDLGDLDSLNGLLSWLGVTSRLARLDGGLVRQNPGAPADKVTNPAEMAEALARIDWAGLSRVPGFEPRRGPAVRGHVAAQGAPLLFMPVPGGPTEAVSGWLGAVPPDRRPGILTGFTQGSLRQWLNERPGRRAFTVLRHPVWRAYSAFEAAHSRGRRDPALAALMRAACGDAPAADETPRELESDRLRRLFIGFLRVMKDTLDGKAPLTPPASWASQSEVLAGFSRFLTPDAILHEAGLSRALPRLASETGVAAPPAYDAERPPQDLLGILDDDVEEAARAAYARDVTMLGFGSFSRDHAA